jgi:alpha-ketoglutarate-dependent sulfate ester dioxygenase
MSTIGIGNHPALDVRPVAGRIGAEIIGARLSGELDSSSVNAIRQARFKYKVIFWQSASHPQARDGARRGADRGRRTPQLHPQEGTVAIC